MTAPAIRLLCFGVALVVGALAYRAHLTPYPVAQWFGGWVIACGFLVVAFASSPEVGEGKTRRALRWTCLAIAIAASGLFYRLASQHGSELSAGITAVSAIVFFLCGRWMPFDPPQIRNLLGSDAATPVPPLAGRGMRIAVGAAAVLTNLASFPINDSNHPAGLAAWLASLLLLAVATWERHPPAIESATWQSDSGPALSKTAQWVAMLVILALGAALRMVALADFPAVVNPDEGRLGDFADLLWRDGHFPNAFGIGWNTFPNLAYMVSYVPIQFLGQSLENFRLGSAVIGTIAIVPVFFWARRWWGGFTALLAAFLMATSSEALLWSRTGLNNVHQILVAAWMLATFARALQRNRLFDWVWFGVAAGACFHTYHACKLYPVLFAVAGAVLVAGIPGLLKRTTAGAAIGALAFLMTVGPQIETSYENWRRVRIDGHNRFDVHKLVDAHQRSDIAGVRDYLHSHVGGCLSVLASRGPTSIVDPITAVPFLIGIGWMFWSWRDPRHLTTLTMMWGILVIGGMVTIYPPAKTRLVGMLPAICVIPAVVIGRGRAVAHEALGATWADRLLAPLLIAFLTASTYANWHNHFVEWPERHRGRLMTALCRAITDTPGPGVVYMVGGRDNPPAVALKECFAAPRPDLQIVDLASDTWFAPLPPDHSGSATILLPRRHESLLPLVEATFGSVRGDLSHELVRDELATSLHIYRLTPRQVRESRGLAGVIHFDNRPAAVTPANGPPFTAPRTHPWNHVRWSGSVFIPEPAVYEWRTLAKGLRIDGTQVTAPRFLAGGWHAIELTTEAGERAPTSLARRTAGSPWHSVRREELSPVTNPGGLLRRHFINPITSDATAPIADRPAYSRLEAGLSIDRSRMWSNEPDPMLAALPSMTEWTGRLRFTGPREIELMTTSPAQLYIGGRRVLDVGAGTTNARTVWQEPGEFSILVRSVRRKQDDPRLNYTMRLRWRELGGPWTSVPGYQPPEQLEELSRTDPGAAKPVIDSPQATR